MQNLKQRGLNFELSDRKVMLYSVLEMLVFFEFLAIPWTSEYVTSLWVFEQERTEAVVCRYSSK